MLSLAAIRDEKDFDGGVVEVRRSGWYGRRKWIIFGVLAAIVAIALGVGLGVGLTRGNNNNGSSGSGSSTPTNSTTPVNGTVSAGIWKPKARTTWQYNLLHPLNDSSTDGIEVWDIDLFDNSASIIAGLQANGSKVICYFSAGSYEDWRPDKNDFNDADLGKDLNGWPGERWLNISSEKVHKIMLARLDIAVEKKCDGVDPDNVDGFANDNGLSLSQTDSVNYMQFLADAAHQRNLSIGLKNAGAIVGDVISLMEWSVNEQCVTYNECDLYAPFIQQDKPVFHVEYPKGDSTNNDIAVSSTQKTDICNNQSAAGFSTIIKNMDLDLWIESCPSS